MARKFLLIPVNTCEKTIVFPQMDDNYDFHVSTVTFIDSAAVVSQKFVTWDAYGERMEHEPCILRVWDCALSRVQGQIFHVTENFLVSLTQDAYAPFAPCMDTPLVS